MTQDYGTAVWAPDIAREGYTLIGWFSDPELTTPFVFDTMPAQNQTLYAKWQTNQYQLTYDVYGNYDPSLDIILQENETIASVTTGWDYSVVLTSNGRVFTWGYNLYGQLGDGTTEDRYFPQEITEYFSLSENETILQISSALLVNFAYTSEGRVFAWGVDIWHLGESGGDWPIITTPTEISYLFEMGEGDDLTYVSSGAALKSSGRIFTWGNNNHGQVGNGTTLFQTSPIDITNQFPLNIDEKITFVSCGGEHTIALTSDGRVFSWGFNGNGQLGDGTELDHFTPVEITDRFALAEGEKITFISTSESRSMALSSEGRLFVWGGNTDGILGDGTTTNRLTPTEITDRLGLIDGETIIEASYGGLHAAILTSSSRVFTWGNNIIGQLGNGTTVDGSSPSELTSFFNLPPDDAIKFISMGFVHSAAISESGDVYYWGNEELGNLEEPFTLFQTTPKIVARYKPADSIITHVYDFNSEISYLVPNREGFTFAGWYEDPEYSLPFDLANMPPRNLKVYGKWVPNE